MVRLLKMSSVFEQTCFAEIFWHCYNDHKLCRPMQNVCSQYVRLSLVL